jgi:outer membrane protein assembly complex protein YaeT
MACVCRFCHWAWRCAAGLFGGKGACPLGLLGILLCGGYRPCPAEDIPALWGRPVTQIHLECDCDLKLQNFPGAVTQQIGQPLDAAKISDSLKRLYATGRFTELRADGSAEGSGVVVTFVARAQFFVGIVSVEGNTGSVDARGLITASRLRLGRPLSSEELSAAQIRLKDMMEANGYYQAQISNQVQRNPRTLEADVLFSVHAGTPALVSAMEFQDHAEFPSQQLMKVSGWHPHMDLTTARLQRGIFRLHQFYIAHGRLQARVSVQQRIYDSKHNTEKLVFKTDAGPLIQVQVRGASISSSQLKDILPLYRDGVTDDQALLACNKALQDHFQEKGYFSAAVYSSRTLHEHPQPTVQILFRVELGPHGDFAGYGVQENAAIPTSQLLSTISPPSEGIILPRPPTFSQDLVEQKTASLLALYHSQGFLDAQVTAEIKDNYQGVTDQRHVTFRIREGARTTVNELSIVGIDSAARNKLWPSLLCKPGQPFSPDRARSDRDLILDYMGDHGYTHASADWHTTASGHADQINLQFDVSPGLQDRIQHIVILGNQHTRASLIDRELVFRDGEPLNQSAIAESQRKLYNLGIFTQVQITPQEQPPSETDKTLLVGLEEARRWSLGYGAGFEVQRLGSNTPQGTFKASPRGSLNLTRLDVGGRGQTFSMGGRLSYIDTGADAGYLIPRLFNSDNLDLRIKGLIDRSREVLTFTEDLKEASMSVEKRFRGTALVIGQYSFQRVEALDISNRVAPAEAALYSQPAIVGMMEGTFIDDSRDDPLDARRGSYTLVNSGVAWKDFASQSDFFRFNGKNSTYYQLSPHFVFARLTQFGVVSHFGGLYSVTVPASNGAPAQVIETNEIPITQRFFMGGSQSMRGFSINQAGPRDPVTGYPIGGDALFLNSVELRTFLAQRRLGVVLFEDAGNVYSSIRDMRLLKVTQSSPEDFNYTSHAVGVGLRFKTPVGPLSFDVGYNLNPPRFDAVTTTNGVSSTQIERLAHFQFFLSFGQSF